MHTTLAVHSKGLTTKSFITILSFLLCISGVIYGQPSPVDSNTVALWHFDETSGNAVVDASPFHNNGTALGTTIIPGQFGNARRFNGQGNYISVPNPVNGSLNFNTTQSFTIEAWFKTTQGDTGEIIRRGLAPVPGYALRIFQGRVQGIIGDREDLFPPSMLLRITSTALYNDGNWHHATLIRDRVQGKLFLYVDGNQAASPLNDNFTLPIVSDRPLMIGRWENIDYPTYFNGDIDEARIVRGAQHPGSTTSDTVALWHLDEQSGQNVLDSSPNHNNGTAFGATIIPGQFGNARRFNGQGNYISVPNPVNGSLNFNTTQSFTIEAWFKTTQGDTGEIIRRGLAPVPGYALRIFQGRVQGIIGDREDVPPPSMLLRITSTALYNDNTWHHATLIRDRVQGKLFLYVDEVQAAPALNDNFTIPISNDHPLTMGRWENFSYPTYFRGDLDEVRILRGARHPQSFFGPDISVSPLSIDFGAVVVGSPSMWPLEIRNVGTRDTLRVTGIVSNNPVFMTNIGTLVLPPGSMQTAQIQYSPTSTQTDTATLSISNNDPDQPVVRVPLRGRGIMLLAAPIISSIRDIPNDQGKQVRVIWHRSIYDGVADSLHIASYNVWRRVDDGLAQRMPSNPPAGTTLTRNGHSYLFSNNELWDFIVTIPAAQFEQYSYVAPTLYDSTIHSGIHWTAFRITAHTTTSVTFTSAPDSGYSVNNIVPHPPMNFSANQVVGGVGLVWEAPPDPDIRNYVVHRSTQPNFIPSPQTLLNSPSVTNYTDTQIGGLSAVYYKVAAIDSAGNQGEYSQEIGLVLTGIRGTGTAPTEFSLSQNYPNPFNPETIITYDIPSETHVMISIYDMSGREVTRLVDEVKQVGSYRMSWKPQNVATGGYVCQIRAGGFQAVRKLLFLK